MLPIIDHGIQWGVTVIRSYPGEREDKTFYGENWVAPIV